MANTGKWCTALDVLSSTKWKVNRSVLPIMDHLFEAGTPIGKMPDSESPMTSRPIPDNASFREISQMRAAEEIVQAKKRQTHSLRADYLLKMKNAKEFLNASEIFIPHNADFRGRAYPIHPHLQHMGSDVPRGLLQFSEAKPLGERGLQWLYIHCANAFGEDKISFEDRVEFAKANLSHICRSGKSVETACEADAWWKSAGKPFQCLATCQEIYRALQESDPRQYLCGLPVHADGSCNGLQHFVALSRDDVGAAHVNMLKTSPSDTPADAYTGVLKVVLELIEKDARSGHPQAQMLQGHVKRLTIKQTVMTTVYGVTMHGAWHQIARQLRSQNMDLTTPEIEACAKYLAKTTLHSLGQVFKRAREVQDWLRSVGRKIVTQSREPLSWTTPLGIPVLQPYVSADAYMVNRKTTGERMGMTAVMELNQANSAKQANAFPPNFIHSLDSSHMYLTALECANHGIAFAGVHDSFWTHPCDMDLLRVLTRQEFINLHTTPLLERLRSALQLQYEVCLPQLPRPGTFDLKNIVEAEYFFA